MDRFKRALARPEPGTGFSSHSRLRTERSATEGGERPLRYRMVREVLLTYLSPILVDSVLTRALHARGLEAASLNEAQLAELASDIMVGLRLFVPEERLPILMLALAEVLESSS